MVMREGEVMSNYDAIVVGARVAGSPTAMHLARKGYRVLLVDRATFPSDTMSTLLIHPPGMAALQRWGLADKIAASGCPAVTAYRIDFGAFAIAGTPRGLPEAPHAYAPRRTVLDKILVDAAADAGAEVREGFSVESLLVEDGVVRGIRGHQQDGRPVEERAAVVVGADGVHSHVARAVAAEKYNEIPAQEVLYYAYWSGVSAAAEFELYGREDRGFGVIPTSDGLTILLVAWPIDQFDANKRDLEATYIASLEGETSIHDRIRGATRESRIVGTAMDNFYRRSFGPGWALAGDAGYYKDAVTAQGISDAFRDAESLSNALDDVFAERLPYAEALGAYQENRDRITMPMFEFTQGFASFDPPPEDQLELFTAIGADPRASNDFMSVLAGTMRVEEFFDPANLDGYFADRRESDGAPALDRR